MCKIYKMGLIPSPQKSPWRAVMSSYGGKLTECLRAAVVTHSWRDTENGPHEGGRTGHLCFLLAWLGSQGLCEWRTLSPPVQRAPVAVTRLCSSGVPCPLWSPRGIRLIGSWKHNTTKSTSLGKRGLGKFNQNSLKRSEACFSVAYHGLIFRKTERPWEFVSKDHLLFIFICGCPVSPLLCMGFL